MTEAYPTLFQPTKLAGVALRNRIAMAPLTRQMALPDGTPTDEMAAYYARRARGGVGLIISEGMFESAAIGSRAYLDQPGLVTDAHVAGWRKVTDAVHAHGAAMIAQLMNGGRVCDPRVLAGQQPVSSSAGQSQGWVLYTDTDYEKQIHLIEGDWPKVTFGPARELTTPEIHAIADGFGAAAARAIEAGFDGVEIHGANGYLIYQFIHPSVNHRTDEWGGSPENRVRFAKLVVEKVRAAIGPDKILTLRLSQDGVDDFAGRWPGGVADATAIGAALADSPLDALHWSSFAYADNRDPNSDVPMPTALKAASGKMLITNGGIADGAIAETALTTGAADLVAVGRPLFAHPDWAYIVRSGQPYPWAPFDRKDVVKPVLDHAIAYPANVTPPNWPTTW